MLTLGKGRRFRLLSFRWASQLPHWSVEGDSLRYTDPSTSKTFRVRTFWENDEPIERYRDMEEVFGEDLNHYVGKYFVDCGLDCVVLKIGDKKGVLPLQLLVELKAPCAECTCDIKWLFSYGCKCGGFKREQAIKRIKCLAA